MPTFDLVREPWIPCLRLDGTVEEVGLRDALCRSHELRALRDPMPTVEFGLYRLLVVLMLDIFRPEDTQMLSTLMAEACFDPARVDAYFTQWQDRFDLFSQPRPFMQAAGMEGEAKPLAGLLPPIPSGTGAAHFHHPHETTFGVSPAAAARLLTAVAPFMTAGGAGLAPSINGAPPWYVLIAGDTLFETLCRNAYVLDQKRLPLGMPAWRDDKPLTPGERSTDAALLEGWTWRPRRVQFLPGGPGRCTLTGVEAPALVRAMRFTAGASCDFVWRDPSVPYKIDDKGPKVMRPQEDKEVWRDTAPLALLSRRDYSRGDAKIQFRRPAVIEQLAAMVQDDYMDKAPLELTLYGMRTDLKMKVFEWSRETLSLPKPLVLQDKFHKEVQNEMERAGQVAYRMRVAVKMTYDREGAGSKAAFDSLAAHAQRRFWAELRPAYDQFLREIAPLPAWPEEDWEGARARWWGAIRKAGTAALGQAIGDLDTNAGALKRQVLAEKSFAGALFTLLMTDNDKAAREAKKKAKPGAQKTKGEPAV